MTTPAFLSHVSAMLKAEQSSAAAFWREDRLLLADMESQFERVAALVDRLSTDVLAQVSFFY